MTSLPGPCCHIERPAASESGLPAAAGEADWEHILAVLPVDLAASARTYGAFQRARGVRSAADLLRLVLLYAQADWSLRQVGAWAALHAWGELSHVALLSRLKASEAWLRHLVGELVGLQRTASLARPGRVRLVDASAISRPGSTGTDWRLHLSVDLAAECIDGLEVTTVRGGETLTRHAVAPGDIVVGDAGYSHPAGLAHLHAAEAAVVVRWAWQSLPLETPAGQPLAPGDWLRELPPGGVAERAVQVRTTQGRLALRLVALRLPQEAADRARARVRRQAQKKGRPASARSLLLAGYVLLVTSLPAATWDTSAVLALYRLRWQIELRFKRLKGLWQLAAVRARQPGLGAVYLLGTLLAALLAQRLAAPLPAAPAAWWGREERPVSRWRWDQLWHEVLSGAIRGPLPREQVLRRLDRLERYLCEGPRQRRLQAASACRALAPPTPAAPPGHAAPAHMPEIA
jgi:hypothetical protein